MNLVTLTEQAFSQKLKSFKQPFTFNPIQRDYALSVAQTLQAQGTTAGILECDTGIGKTLGYLIPLLLWAAENQQRVAVSTHTNALQRQIAEGDLPIALKVVESLTGKGLDSVVRRGMRHYIAAHRALTQAEAIDNPTERDTFMAWLNEKEDGHPLLIDDWKQQHGKLPAGISEIEVCCQPWDDGDNLADYHADAHRARRVDIVIGNHALLVLQARRGRIFGDIGALVIDEADRLADAALLIGSASLPLARIRHLLTADSTENLYRLATEALGDEASVPLVNLSARKARRYLHELDQLHHALMAAARQSDDPEVAGLLEHYARNAVLIKSGLQNGAMWAVPAVTSSSVRHRPSLELVPLNPEQFIRRLLRGDHQPCVDHLILTSATLSDGRRLDAVAYRYGLINKPITLSVVKRFSATQFGQMSYILGGPHYPTPTLKDEPKGVLTNPLWIQRTAEHIISVAQNNQRVYILTLSYRDTASLAEPVSAHLSNRLIVHTPGLSLADVVRQYCDTPHGVLITPAGWEGVDLPGLIDQLVITRIPYAPPNRLYAKAIQYAYRLRGQADAAANRVIYARALEEAKRKLRQAQGRGIRKDDDTVTVSITDPRMSVYSADGSAQTFASVIPDRFIQAWENATVLAPEQKAVVDNPWGVHDATTPVL